MDTEEGEEEGEGGGGGTPAKLCRQSKLASKMTPLCMHVPTDTGWASVQYVPQAQPPGKCVMINTIIQV